MDAAHGVPYGRPMIKWLVFWAVVAVFAAGCQAGADDGSAMAGGDGDGDGDACMPRDADGIPDGGECVVADGDFAPCTDDGWDACISDDGAYHRIEPTISSIARVAAFEEIAQMLFDPTSDADGDAFLAARLMYQEDEGLDSRVVRRYDPHFDVPADTDCSANGVPDSYPDYCVGPALLSPALLDALNDGIQGTDPRQNAARVEAGLLWFLYVSTYKESLTCTDTAKDCDSAYAYYTGGESARGGVGLSRYVREVDPYAHDRVWDGLLALRCWRDLDDGETAQNTAQRDQAREQVDRAELAGLASIFRSRLDLLAAATVVDEQAYHDAFLRALAPVFDRALRAVSPDEADAFAAAVEAADIDTATAADALSSAIDCP